MRIGLRRSSSINVAGSAITGLVDSKGQEVPIARFEPLLIGSIFPTHGEDRIVLTPADVPPMLPAALKAVEDRKFDTHHGVDPTAIARAVWANLKAGGIAQGGSTAHAAARAQLLPHDGSDAESQAARSGDVDRARARTSRRRIS